MIVRVWSGATPRSNAAGFLDHLKATGIAEYRQQPGCLGAEVWSEEQGNDIRFTLVSHWVSREAIVGYAGFDSDEAVLYPGDGTFNLRPDLSVHHYEQCCSGFTRWGLLVRQALAGHPVRILAAVKKLPWVPRRK